MGMKLHLECLQLSLRELCFKLRGPNFPVAKLAIVLAAVPDTENCPVRENVDMKVRNKSNLNRFERLKQMERLGTEGLDNNFGDHELKGR
jgi:hypothetical protein